MMRPVLLAGFGFTLVHVSACGGVNDFVRDNQMERASWRCSRIRQPPERSACFQLLGDAHVRRAQYREALGAYKEAELPGNDPRRINARYLLGLHQVRAGEHEKAERTLRTAGISASDAALAVAVEGLRLQPAEEHLARTRSYLQESGFTKQEASRIVGNVAFAAAVEGSNPAVEALAARYLTEAGVEPGRDLLDLKERHEQQLRMQREVARQAVCQELPGDLARVKPIVDTLCQPLLEQWRKEPVAQEVNETYTVHPGPGFAGGIVRYGSGDRRLVPVDRGPKVVECYHAVSMRLRYLAEATANCGLSAQSGEARALFAKAKQDSDVIPASRTVQVANQPVSSPPYPYAAVVRFVPPNPKKDGAGYSGLSFEQAGLREGLQNALAQSGLFQWIRLAEEAPADFVAEGEVPMFRLRPGQSDYEVEATVRITDSNGRFVAGGRAVAPGNYPKGHLPIFNQAHSHATAVQAMAAAIEKLKPQLAAYIDQRSAVTPPETMQHKAD
jgi:tetratricopeptide (TPR) repeat protein